MEKMLRVSVATIALVGVMFAGCTELFGSDSQGSLSRIIEMRMDSDAMTDLEYVDTPEEFMDAIGTASYIYTHKKGDVKAADVKVEFIDDAGRERNVGLDQFTQSGTLSEGDTVTIDGVAMYSTIRLRADGETLASRGKENVDWFAIDGVPLPVAGDPGASASWKTTTTYQSSMSFDQAGFHEYEEYDTTCYNENTEQFEACTEYWEERVMAENGQYDALVEIVTELGFDVTRAGSGERLDVTAGMSGSAAIFADVLAYSHSEEGTLEDGTRNPSYSSTDADGHFGGQVTDATMEAGGTGSMFFDRSGALTKIGGEGSVYGDATVYVWENATSAEGEELEMDHPFVDETEPYTEDSYEDYGEGDEASDLLADLWAMDLRVGDEFHVTADMMDLGEAFGTNDGFLFSYELIVVEREDKVVGNTAYDALRLQGHTELTYVIDGEESELDFAEFTLWVGAKSYVPVYLEATYGQSIGLEDLNPFLDEFEAQMNEGTMTRPTEFEASGTVTTIVEIMELSGDLRVAASLTIGGLFNSPYLALAPMGLAMDAMYEDDYYYEDEYWEDDWDNGYGRGGDVTFTRQTAGLTITVVASDYATFWEELSISGCQDWPDGLIIAGEELTGCTGHVTIVYEPTGTILYSGI